MIAAYYAAIGDCRVLRGNQKKKIFFQKIFFEKNFPNKNRLMCNMQRFMIAAYYVAIGDCCVLCGDQKNYEAKDNFFQKNFSLEKFFSFKSKLMRNTWQLMIGAYYAVMNNFMLSFEKKKFQTIIDA
jgi:hypothetical protein